MSISLTAGKLGGGAPGRKRKSPSFCREVFQVSSLVAQVCFTPRDPNANLFRRVHNRYDANRFEHRDMQFQNVRGPGNDALTADALVSPVDELLAAYGSGALDPARHALVASHLILRPENRRFVRAVEEYTTSGLLSVESVAPARHRDQRLAAIFGSSEPAPAPVIPAEQDGLLPAPLRRYLGCDMNALGWRFVVPGVREVKIAEEGRGEVSLIHVRAGRRLPQHTHEGSEITLVLKGAFVDPLGRYGRGDIAIADSALEHSPEIEGDVDCICFAVTDAPLRLSSPIGRMVEKILSRIH